MAQSIQTSKFGTLDTSGRVPVSLTGVGSDPALGLGLSFNVGGKEYTFIPEDRITQGAASGSSGALFTGFLDPKVLSTLKNSSEYIDLSGTNFGSFDAGNFVAKNMGGSTKGFLAPKEVVDPVLASPITLYDPSFAGKASGIGNANGKPAYILPSGYADNSGQVTKSETKLVGYRYSGGGGLLGGLSDAFTQVFQPIEKSVSQNLAQLDKDLSLSQNAPLIAAIALSVAAPGVGSAIGQQMITAGLLPAATSAAVATAVGTGIANAALQVAQGKSPEEALKVGVIGAAGGAVGNYLVGDPGTVNNFVTSTSTNLLAGKSPVEAVQSGIVSSGAGLAGGTVAQGTGSAVAGQVAAGTTAGLLAGQTGEQALIRGVGNIKVDGLTSSIPPSTTAFDTTTDISDTSGFDIPTPTPQTPITGNTGGNMATYDDPTGGAGQYYGTEDDFYNQLYNYQGTPIDYATDPTGMMNSSNTQFYDDPTGGAGGMGTSQDPSMYGNLTVGQLQRLLGGGGGARQPATQSALQRILSGFTGRQPSLQLGGAASQLGNLLGGAVSGAGGILAGQTSAKASEEQARMISEATGQAVGGSQFRPVGTTTRFGTSQFQVDPTTGQLTSAGYQLTPELKAMQDRVMALTGKGLTEAELAGDRYSPLTAGAKGLFGLGQQYLAQSPEQVAADYMARQQDLLAPSRERQLAQLQTQLFNTGRGGLSVGGTGMRPGGGQGLRAASPEMEAYYNALAQQDAQLAAGAQQAGQQQVQFGAGLMGTGANLLGAYGQGLTGAYAPFSTGIGVGSQLEQLGQQPLSISQELAKLSSASGARAGELGIRGTTAASVARLPSMQYNPLSRALVGAGGNTQFGGALGEFIGGALPGLFGTGTTINPLRTDEFGYQTGYSGPDGPIVLD